MGRDPLYSRPMACGTWSIQTLKASLVRQRQPHHTINDLDVIVGDFDIEEQPAADDIVAAGRLCAFPPRFHQRAGPQGCRRFWVSCTLGSISNRVWSSNVSTTLPSTSIEPNESRRARSPYHTHIKTCHKPRLATKPSCTY